MGRWSVDPTPFAGGMADKMSIDKTPSTLPQLPPANGHQEQKQEPSRERPQEDSEDSLDSSPDGEQNSSAPTGNGISMSAISQDGQQPKRKGGRKPIYATSEERKQRNRQAQAAFRERRTEYIKQLEETIRVHETNLHSLQTAHRTAADECLMLRYKNSLLERILLEKGIDVQAELRAKTGSPNLGPTHMPQNLVQPPPIQRAIMNRHHQSRRSNSNIAPKNEPISLVTANGTTASPKNQHTPSSHSNSPTTTTPASASAFSPTTSDNVSMRGPAYTARRSMGMPAHLMTTSGAGAVANRSPQTVGTRPPFYTTPAFQNHLEQLEPGYEGHADMVDDPEMETTGAAAPFAPGFQAENHQFPSPTTNGTGQHTSHHEPPHGLHSAPQTTSAQYPSMTQLLDQNLDWDPFGLSASMAFPPQPYHPDHHNIR